MTLVLVGIGGAVVTDVPRPLSFDSSSKQILWQEKCISGQLGGVGRHFILIGNIVLFCTCTY